MPHFLVTVGWGPARDPARGRREQAGWAEHAAFMDDLVARGVVLVGGPVGTDIDGGDVVLAVRADDAAAARAALAADPWAGDMLTIKSVRPWALWLRAPGP